MPPPDNTEKDPAPAKAQDEHVPTPPAGEQTLAQTVNWPLSFGGGFGAMLTAGSPLLFSGGSLANPCGFPGYAAGAGNAYFGLFGTYRWMLEHPTIRLARAVVTSPLLASSWFVEHDDDVDEDAVALVERTFNALRESSLSEILRAIDYGPSMFEPVWEIVDGKLVIERLKALLVDTTAPLVDPYGSFIGLRPGSMASPLASDAAGTMTTLGQKDLDARVGKAWMYVHDGEAGNLWGRSRLENIRRTAWRDWLDTAQQLQALSGKLSGRQAYAVVPSGGYPDPTDRTKQRTFMQDAADALAGFAQGKNPVLTSPTLTSAMAGNDLALMKQMMGAAPVTFQTVDFGTESQAIGGLLDRLRYNDGLIFAGYLRSPRTALESENGSRADSQQHTDTGMTDSQLLGNDICRQLQTLVDYMVSLNWGLKKGAIRLRQSPLIDDSKQTLQAILPMLLADPATLKVATKIIDTDKVLDALDVPRDGDAEQAEKEVQKEMADQQAQQMEHEKALAAKPMVPGQPGKPAAGKNGKPGGVNLARSDAADTDEAPSAPAPTVNFAAGAFQINPPQQPAPQVNVAPAAPANVVVNVPEQKPAQVTVNVPEQAAPQVTVAPAQVVVNVPEPKPAPPVRIVKTLKRNAAGLVTGSIEETAAPEEVS